MPTREEEKTIISEGLRLRGRICRSATNRAKNRHPLLILCHGIPGRSPGDHPGKDDGGYPALARRCAERGFTVFHFNFRGAGESEGNFDLAGWRRDLKAVLDFWERERGERAFLLWGFSAGAAVSCCVAAHDPRVKGVVMAASPAEFCSIFPSTQWQHFLDQTRRRGIIRDASFPADPTEWLRGIYGASPLMYISALAPRPLLILHGSKDELIPYHHAFRLYNAAGHSACLVIQPGAAHQLRLHPPAVERCLQFLESWK